MAASISERPGKRDKDLSADGNKQGERTRAIVDRDAVSSNYQQSVHRDALA
jgi:hypothetical protein